MSDEPTLAIVIAGPAGPVRDALAAELSDGIATPTELHVGDDAQPVLSALPDRLTLGLMVLLDDGSDVDARLTDIDADPRGRTACVVLVTPRRLLADLHGAVDRHRLSAIIPTTWPSGRLADHASSQLARWLRARDPADPRLAALDRRSRPRELPDSALLRDLELSEGALVTRLVDALERALGPRPRLRLPAGTRLTHQGVGVDGVFVVLDGAVALDRASEVGELRLHHASTGPVVGLLSLTQQRQAFFTARTTTDTVLLHLSLEQLDHALDTEPEVGAALAAATARALAQRLRRAEQLQVEKVLLNRELDREREQLATTLSELESTRLELVESARMATLGELAAGVAHELNNPAAAVSRAASFIADDLSSLLAAHPRGAALEEFLVTAGERAPIGTAAQRVQRRALTAVVGDEQLARRLVAAGISDGDRVAALVAGLGPGEVAELVTAAELGSAVRNLQLGTRRITELVESLRSYARPSTEPQAGIDVRRTLDDTLHLLAHRLDGVSIDRVDADDLPTITGHPGPLGQVWTNLLLNAVEAAGEGGGHLRIRTDREGDEVVVTIADDGPGIPAEDLPRLFEPRFTTKQGQVRYGLGLGLAISERIVHAHGGTITISSQPGDTVATVRLPITSREDPPCD